jgi:hypothetical protein
VLSAVLVSTYRPVVRKRHDFVGIDQVVASRHPDR